MAGCRGTAKWRVRLFGVKSLVQIVRLSIRLRQQNVCGGILQISKLLVSIELLGTYCRGGPPWPPLRGNRVRQTERRRLYESGEFHAGAATKGRPYSTFRGRP
jgi:hypothetical protein